jgi:hypothetical protein
LARQDRVPDRVIVVARPDDVDTWEAARGVTEDRLPVTVVAVQEQGVVAALRAGVAATRAPRVAFTDDDAVPHPGWLSGLGALLDQPAVGAGGGRDLVPGQLGPRRHTVGTLAPWGRFSGNHHLGRGPARDVHVVKGVNMAFRAEALAVPREGVLRGRGAEPHYELLMCAWARDRGWRVRYDSAITVDHRVRSDESLTHAPDPRAEASSWRSAAHNLVLGGIATEPQRWVTTVTYGVLVGTREAPGLLRSLAGVARGERDMPRHARAAMAGTWDALLDVSTWGGVSVPREAMVPCDELRGVL